VFQGFDTSAEPFCQLLACLLSHCTSHLLGSRVFNPASRDSLRHGCRGALALDPPRDPAANEKLSRQARFACARREVTNMKSVK
jgi:hypothetical protein